MNLISFTQTNHKGQIVIPKAIRDYLKIEPGDNLQASVQGNSLCLSPIEEVITRVDKENTLADLLQKTKGAWVGESVISKTKVKLELKASTTRKQAW